MTKRKLRSIVSGIAVSFFLFILVSFLNSQLGNYPQLADALRPYLPASMIAVSPSPAVLGDQKEATGETQEQNSAEQKASKTATPTSEGTSASDQQTGTQSGSVGQKGELAVVKKVVDGDTIELENGQRVRYIGVDTPESKKPNTPVQCFSIEAGKRNKELVEGKTVRLVKDVSNTDRYQRLLRYVYVDDVLINEQLVREGFAFARSYPPDIAMQDTFKTAEASARNANAGLWSSCSVANEHVTN